MITENSNIDMESYNKLVESYNRYNTSRYNCDQTYGDMVYQYTMLNSYLSLYCTQDTIDYIFKLINNYVIAGDVDMDTIKRDNGIPECEDPFIHMNLPLLGLYSFAYMRVYNRVKGLATPESIKKEVEDIFKGNINRNELSMENNNKLEYKSTNNNNSFTDYKFSNNSNNFTSYPYNRNVIY